MAKLTIVVRVSRRTDTSRVLDIIILNDIFRCVIILAKQALVGVGSWALGGIPGLKIHSG